MAADIRKLIFCLAVFGAFVAMCCHGQENIKDQLAFNAHQTKLNYQTFDLMYDFVDSKEFHVDPIEYGPEPWVAFYFAANKEVALMTQYFPEERLIRVTLKKKPGVKIAYNLKMFTQQDIGRD